MKTVFGFCFVLSMAASEIVLWVFLGHFGLLAKVGFSVLAPVILIVAILLAEAVLIGLGYEGKSAFTRESHKSSVRGLVGCGLFLALLVVIVPWLRQGENRAAEGDLLEGSNKEAMQALNQKLDIWRDSLDKIGTAKTRFETDKAILAVKLKAMGFQTPGDATKSPSHKKVVDELVELQGQIEMLKKQEAGYTLAIDDVQSALRRLSRQETLKNAGVSKDDISRLTQTAAELDERLEGQKKGQERTPIEIEVLLTEVLDSSPKK